MPEDGRTDGWMEGNVRDPGKYSDGILPPAPAGRVVHGHYVRWLMEPKNEGIIGGGIIHCEAE
jgi:hypothetical protein